MCTYFMFGVTTSVGYLHNVVSLSEQLCPYGIYTNINYCEQLISLSKQTNGTDVLLFCKRKECFILVHVQCNGIVPT